jgi:hypothetical protein
MVNKVELIRLRLEIELVPKPLWGRSLAKILPKKEWLALKTQRLQEKGGRCEICNHTDGLQLHEIWEYDDGRHIQRLVAFRLLCDKCHSIKHFGRTQTLAAEGKIDLKPIIVHFCKVNNCTFQDLREHWKSVYETWRERSKHQWTQELGPACKPDPG